MENFELTMRVGDVLGWEYSKRGSDEAWIAINPDREIIWGGAAPYDNDLPEMIEGGIEQKMLPDWANSADDAVALVSGAHCDFKLRPQVDALGQPVTSYEALVWQGDVPGIAFSGKSLAVAICKAWLMSRGAADG